MRTKESSLMESALEVQRLAAVYREYHRRNLGRSKWSPANPGNQAIVRERERVLGELLAQAGLLPLCDRRILDIGCGTDTVLAGFQKWGASPGNLFGVDLLPSRIHTAQQRFPDLVFKQSNAEVLPFADGDFDLVLLFTVFSSILSRPMATNISHEVTRILRPGGGIIWYDFRVKSPFNRHVRRISREGIEQLFPGFQSRLETITLLPPLARRLGRLTERLYPALAKLPFLRTHYLGLLLKP
jgi:ubiquinone/menaquinone biosynthesis C-methylase UbiE